MFGKSSKKEIKTENLLAGIDKDKLVKEILTRHIENILDDRLLEEVSLYYKQEILPEVMKRLKDNKEEVIQDSVAVANNIRTSIFSFLKNDFFLSKDRIRSTIKSIFEYDV